MIFGALVILLIALTLALLIIPVLRKPSTNDSLGREQQNIVIAKDKKALLENQLAEGQMTQQDYDAAFADLEASLALDLERQQALGDNLEAGKWAVWAFAAFVPALSIYMYLQLGEYRVIDDPSLAQPRPSVESASHGTGQAPSLSEMINKVKDHLREEPDDARGWFILGRTLMSIQQYSEAATALQRSYSLNNQEPSVMLALADALAMTNDGVMTGEPEKLVLQALELSPNELTGLWLAGLAAEQGGRLRESFNYFVRLLPMLTDDPQSTKELKSMLVSLKERQPDLPELPEDMAPVAVPAIASASSSVPDVASASESAISVSVTLDDTLKSQARPSDLVFVYAKAASGPPMPLAAKKLKVSDLPFTVSLSDNDAVMAQMKLTNFEQIKIGARISKSGGPVGKPGDLFDETGAINRTSINGIVELNIYQVK